MRVNWDDMSIDFSSVNGAQSIFEKWLLLSVLLWIWSSLRIQLGFPGGSVGKESTCDAGDMEDMGSIPALGKSLGRGHGNPLQDPALENPMDRGAWWASVHRVAKSQTWLK